MVASEIRTNKKKIVTTYMTELIHFSCLKNEIIWFQ